MSYDGAGQVKALVTGGGGFLGRKIVEQLLERGWSVRVLCRSHPASLEALPVEIILGDICDRQSVAAACDGVEVVFHVAGVAGLGGSWQRYYRTNTLGTRNVLEACQRQRVGRLVYTSSPSVTFDGTDQCGVDESAPYPKRWLAHYPRSKALAEQMVLAANGHNGLLTCALRPHLIWGPGDRQLIPRLLQRARSGRLRRVGDGRNLIDTVYVDNAARAHLLAADAISPGSPAAGSAYFISQGQPVNCWQWIDQILALAGLPPVRRGVTLKMAWRIGLVFELLYAVLRIDSDPPMTRFLAAQLGTSHYYDISRARRELGYQPEISTAEGMQLLARELAVHNRE